MDQSIQMYHADVPSLLTSRSYRIEETRNLYFRNIHKRNFTNLSPFIDTRNALQILVRGLPRVSNKKIRSNGQVTRAEARRKGRRYPVIGTHANRRTRRITTTASHHQQHWPSSYQATDTHSPDITIFTRFPSREVNVTVRRWGPGANAVPRGNLEGCQCQGLAGPRATTKPVRSHVE